MNGYSQNPYSSQDMGQPMLNFPYMDGGDKSEVRSIYDLNSDKLLNELEHKFKGEVFDVLTGEWIKKNEELMNDKGVSVIMSILQIHLSPFNVLSILDQKKIDRICYTASSNIADSLYINSEDFGIKPSFFLLIVDMIDSIIEINLTRALNGKTLELYMKSQRRIETINSQQPQKSNSLFGKIGSKFKI